MKGAVAVGSGEGTPEVSEGEMQAGGGSESGNEGGSEGGEDGEGTEGGEGGGSEGVDVDTDTLALYGIAAVIAFLSPLGFFALMARHADDDAP